MKSENKKLEFTPKSQELLRSIAKLGMIIASVGSIFATLNLLSLIKVADFSNIVSVFISLTILLLNITAIVSLFKYSLKIRSEKDFTDEVKINIAFNNLKMYFQIGAGLTITSLSLTLLIIILKNI